MALMATALCFGVTSCGDDEVEPDGPGSVVVPDVDETVNGNNGAIDFRDGSSNPIPYPTHFSMAEGAFISLSACDVNSKEKYKLTHLDEGSMSVDYDNEYFSRAEFWDHYAEADDGTFFELKALKPTNGKETPVTLNYKFNGKAYKTVFYVTITTVGEDQKDLARRKAINDYWELQKGKESPVDLAKVSPTPVPAVIETNNGVMLLKTSSRSVNEVTQNYAPVNNSYIYPGSIVYINQKLADGTPEPVNFGTGGQGTVTVYLNFLVGEKKEVAIHNVPNEKSSIQAAINKLLSQVVGSGEMNVVTAPGDLDKQQTCSNSQEEMSIDLNLSTNFLNTTCKVKTNTSTSSQKIYKMDTFHQSFYDIEVEPEGGDRTNYFGKSITLDDIKRMESRGNGKLGIIKAVYYGRFGYYCKEYESSKFHFVGSDSIKYKDKFSGDSKQDISSFCSSTREYSRIFGGDPSTAGQAMDNDSVFMKTMLSNCKLSLSNQGVPIYYVVEYLGTGDEVVSKQTGSYNHITEYIPAPSRLDIHIENHAAVPAGANMYVDLFYKAFKMVNGKDVDIKTTYKEEKPVDTWEKENIGFGFGDDESSRDLTIALPKGQYFRPEAHIRITHQHVWKGDYMTSGEGRIYIGDGFLKLCIEGSAYKGQNDPWFKQEDNSYDVLIQGTKAAAKRKTPKIPFK